VRPVVLLSQAADDLAAAEDFYEAHGPGMGSYCVDSLLSDVESLVLFHGIHSVHFGCHRMLASRFPFGIYYLETPKETRVVAILDLRRNPSWIREELKDRGRSP
jgi:hypothetical protein